jgi:hypothetical protein
MKLTPELTDAAVLAELGARLARRRIDATLTQALLAERLESGRSTDFSMLVRVLRALKLTEGLDALIADAPQSPIALLKQKGRERKRARHPRGSAGGAQARPPAGPWKWRE